MRPSLKFFKSLLRTAIGKVVPRKAIFLSQLANAFFYDFKRFVVSSSALGNANSSEKLLAIIRVDSHRLEKGLSLKSPRPGFGLPVAGRLLSNILLFLERWGFDKRLGDAINVLFQYQSFNQGKGAVDPNPKKKLSLLRSKMEEGMLEELGHCVIDVKRKDVLKHSKVDLKNFLDSRHSVRDFDSKLVSDDLIKAAVELAQKAPSACNRQSARVYVFSGKEDRARILSCQNGNRGFGENADRVLVVTSDLQSFISPGERNQCWIDGGMYAMSLVYALHSLGLGSCCLNWDVTNAMDQKLRAVSGIPQNEAIILLIAVGHLPKNFKVTRSSRKSLREVLFFR